MKTQELFNVLKEHGDKSLLFEYTPGKLVGTNYHITEVKHIAIDSVDCGANADNWNETVIQLWESPLEIGKRDYMSVYKALSILNKVGKMRIYDVDAEVKFEYSNSTFHTAQLFVNDFEINGNKLIFKLAVEKTDCKAKTVCGTAAAVGSAVVGNVKEVIIGDEPCCSPDGNCC